MYNVHLVRILKKWLIYDNARSGKLWKNPYMMMICDMYPEGRTRKCRQ